jgi:hypothetical protein
MWHQFVQPAWAASRSFLFTIERCVRYIRRPAVENKANPLQPLRDEHACAGADVDAAVQSVRCPAALCAGVTLLKKQKQ